jgi:Ankyrin repeats (3 copies)
MYHLADKLQKRGGFSMKFRHMFTVFLSVLLISTAAFAQNSKQELNDQLYEAVRKGDLAAVTSLLDKGADVNAKFRYGATALFKAAERGHTEIAKLLLARGADATVKDTFYGATAMSWALDNGHVEVVRAILDKDPASVNDVLMSGVREGKQDLVEVALSRGGVKPETLTAALAGAMDDKDKTAIADMLRKAGATPPPEIDSATLQTYVGKYRNEQGTELNVTTNTGKLFVTPPNQPPLALMAVDKITFRPTAFDGLVVTVNVEGAKAVSLSVKQGATTTVFKRVEETQPK